MVTLLRLAGWILCAILLRAEAGELPTTLVFPPYRHSYGIQKATQTKLQMLLPLQSWFDNPQGVAVTKMRARDDTTTEADDDEVTVYGVNSGRGEIIYNTSMYGLALWGGRGRGKRKMMDPKGIACDEEGNVYICDTGNHRIIHLFNPQKKVKFVKHIGEGFLRSPTHLVLDGQGLIYVSDTGNDRILVLNREGTVVWEIRGAGGFPVKSPLGIAINHHSERWHYFKKDYLFFLNDSGRTLVRLNLADSSAVSIVPDTAVGRKCTYDFMATDYYSNVYLTDGQRGTIDKYSLNLTHLTSFGTPGGGERQFGDPRSITIWKRYGQTFVTERGGAQYYWVGTDFRNVALKAPPRPKGAKKKFPAALPQEPYRLTGELTEASYISLYRVSPAGDTLDTLFRRAFRLPLLFEVRFHPHGAPGKTDRWLAVFEPTYSSYTYFEKPVTVEAR